MRLTLDIALPPEAAAEFIALLTKHPPPWSSERGCVRDANGTNFLAIDGDGYEGRWLLAAVVALLPGGMRL